jgi:D-lactate dehydrogenase
VSHPELADEIDAAYAHEGVDTCAADGMCATACPVRIDTGKLMKRLRSERHGAPARAAGTALAKHWEGTSTAARTGLRAAAAVPGLAAAASRVARRVLPDELVPQYGRDVPSGGDTRPGPRHPAAPRAVFFPTCLHQVFAPDSGPGDGARRSSTTGKGAGHAFLDLCARVGVEVAVPDGIEGLCCGTPWESKGFVAGHAEIARRTLDALWTATDGGALPVVVDASSCTYGLTGLADVLPDDPRAASLTLVDAVSFVAEHVLPGLTVTDRAASLALHPTCSTTHLGIGADLHLLAEAVADEVVVPLSWGCCGFAGDRGLLHPELTASATAEQAAELAGKPTELAASCNRTCEIGMSRATGRSYRHVLEHLAERTVP